MIHNTNFDFSLIDKSEQPTISQQDILSEADQALRLQKINPFPVEVFPKPIQEIITATNESLNFPIDFIGASILYAASVSIGNTHSAEVKKGFSQSAVLYIAIVGKAGTNKSHPLSFAIKPIEERDNLKFQEYQNKKLEYDSILSLNKKEREQQGYNEPVKPIWEQLLVNDFTPEALTEVHKFNKRGIGVYADELASWFKNFNRYNKGSEEQFWLSVWSGKPIRINRKTSEPVNIPLPFISVAGTIQPAVLNELADNRTKNGFLDRLLFVIPNNLKKEYWNENELNPVLVENWQAIISNLLNLSISEDQISNPKPEVLSFEPEAKAVLLEFQRKLTDRCNEAESDTLSGIIAKIEMYTVRLALILQMLQYACNEGNKDAIGMKAIKGALQLVEYFIETATKVHDIVSNTSPLDKLPADKQILYSALPESFTTESGLLIAQQLEVPERTFEYFLRNSKLFEKIKRGEYKKLY